MKYGLNILLLLVILDVYSQETKTNYTSIEANYFYGTILEHNPDIGHLITHHPEGVLIKFNQKTFGFKSWESRYNYPDVGFSFIYQNMKNPYLGSMYSIYGHMSFYFLNRNLKITLGQGIAYATNPYDAENNYINNAYGTHFLSSTYLSTAFVKENIWEGIGVHLGITISHYSNGNLKAPNNSTNTFGLSAGLSYQLDHTTLPDFIETYEEFVQQPIRYNVVFRTGINESDVIGMGRYLPLQIKK